MERKRAGRNKQEIKKTKNRRKLLICMQVNVQKQGQNKKENYNTTHHKET